MLSCICLLISADTTWRLGLIGSTNLHSFALLQLAGSGRKLCIDYQMNSFSDSFTNKER